MLITKAKSEADLIRQAISQLLKAVKIKADRRGKSLRKAELLRQGYSEHFANRVIEKVSK